MNSEQRAREKSYQSFTSHIRFWEAPPSPLLKKERWPHFTDEEIQAAFERCERKLAYWREQARRRRPPWDEIKQDLPRLIAEDMKRRAIKTIPPPLSSSLGSPTQNDRPQGPKALPGSVPLP